MIDFLSEQGEFIENHHPVKSFTHGKRKNP